ncbi:MAG: peptidoglycan bridge formation glycyltransferase FemA/FemB family protein, partial [Limnohabitans sp.]
TLPLGGLTFMVVTPDEPLNDDLGLRRFRRVMTGYSTVQLDISQPLDVLRAQLDSRWRQPLAHAENAGLNVQRMGTNPGQYRWLLDAEMKQRAERHLDGMPLVWFERYAESRKQPARNLLSFRADMGRDRLAGMLFLIHGQAATYQIGWTSQAGRETNAHHLMLWRGIEALQERGVRMLDLGGVNTQRSAGVARFKMAMGGVVKRLAGSYLL